MSELKELIKRELRSHMIKVKRVNLIRISEAVAASQELDAVLDKYQEIMMKKSNAQGRLE